MPEPRDDESHDDFIERCMSDGEAQSDFPDRDQRLAFCESQWDQSTERSMVSTIDRNGVNELASRKLQPRTMTLRAESVDRESRTVQAVLATEERTAVFAMDRVEVIEEQLQMDGVRMPAQMPMLEDHLNLGIQTVLGSIDNIEVQGGQLVGRLRFAEGPDNEDSPEARAWRLVAGGHVTDVSVGYRAIEFFDIAPGQTQVVNGREFRAGDLPLRITTAWQPAEGSLVAIGADENAQIRRTINVGSQRKETSMCECQQQRNGSTQLQQRGEALAAELEDQIEEEVTEERPRQEVIGDMAEAAGIDVSTVTPTLDAEIECPPRDRIEGFASALDVSMDSLMAAAREDGCEFGDDSGNGGENSNDNGNGGGNNE